MWKIILYVFLAFLGLSLVATFFNWGLLILAVVGGVYVYKRFIKKG
jgi:ABC-type dipeptide/oligopeptide/nickel transport system permease subunit